MRVWVVAAAVLIGTLGVLGLVGLAGMASAQAPAQRGQDVPSAPRQAVNAPPVEYRFADGVRCYTVSSGLGGAGIACVVVP